MITHANPFNRNLVEQEISSTSAQLPVTVRSTSGAGKRVKHVDFKSVYEWGCLRKEFDWIEFVVDDRSTDGHQNILLPFSLL